MLAYHRFPRTLGTLLMLASCLPFPAAARSNVETRPVVSPEIDSQALLRLARKLKASDQPLLAVDAYRRLLRSGPQDDAVKLEFADSLEAANLLDEASGTYLSLSNNSATASGAYLGLMHIHLKLGEPAKVLDEYTRLQGRGAISDIRVFLCRGVALDRLQRHAEAQASYRQALTLAPRSISARNNLALSLALDRHYDEAVELLRPLAASADATPRVRQNLALIYGLMGKADLAAQLGASDLSPEDVTANTRFFNSIRP